MTFFLKDETKKQNTSCFFYKKEHKVSRKRSYILIHIWICSYPFEKCLQQKVVILKPTKGLSKGRNVLNVLVYGMHHSYKKKQKKKINKNMQSTSHNEQEIENEVPFFTRFTWTL